MLNIRVKVFIIIKEVLVFHLPFYHGYRKREQPNSSDLRDFRLSKLYRGVQLYHTESGMNLHTGAMGKGCLTFPNLSLIWPECHMKGLTGCLS